MSFRVLFFDLDDTLYRSDSGLWGAIAQRMSDYMAERLGLSWDVIPRLREQYYHRYGTTLNGLRAHHQVDADDFLAYVHDLPLEHYLVANPDLRRMLASLPQGKWVFTNADANHARRVLAVLGLEGCFDGIIDLRALEFACKPQPEAFRRALKIVGGAKPAECVFFDDSPKNLAVAHRIGLTTVLVGRQNGSRGIDYVIPHLLSLPEVLPQLFDCSEEVQQC